VPRTAQFRAGAPRRRARPEGEFNDRIRREARKLGWLTYHTRRSKGSEPGWPDVVLCHPRTGWLIVAELKATPKDKPTEPQEAWIHALCNAGIDVYVWNPEHERYIMDLLIEGATNARKTDVLAD